MWKKDDSSQMEPKETRPEATAPRSEPRAPKPPVGGRATIGRSITIKGEVTGDEDLLIEGSVDGSVDLKQHSVTVGPDGNVKADITGLVVTVEGSVEGNLRAEQQVVLRASARVQGDITSPRVVLEDGAAFRGGVDMGELSGGDKRGGAKAPEAQRSTPTSSTTSEATTDRVKEASGKAAGATP